jgi:pimeloyl-ACP methyl ester carboxylesterase
MDFVDQAPRQGGNFVPHAETGGEVRIDHLTESSSDIRLLPFSVGDLSPTVMPEPIVFGGCSGWYHPATSNLGVILCGPHGYEELCVHRHWRRLAQDLADRGLPTLRFDYPGTGDSIGDDETPGQVAAWIESIRDAVRVMRSMSGVDRIALVGLRMGAMLATAAAEQIGNITALVLLAPIGSGEACFRELRALALMRAPARHRHAAAVGQDGRLEAAGFLYTAETLADLRALPLVQSGRPPAESVLLLNRPNASINRDFQARLHGSGAAVEEETFHDYPLLLRDADVSAYPERGFGQAVDWLAALREGAAPLAPQPRSCPSLSLPDATETPVYFSRTPNFFGVMCEPHAITRRPVLVFLNTGANHHIGTSRMTVTMTRRLAQMGFASLRFDIGGVGDSDALSPHSSHHPSDPAATADVRRALDWLQGKGYTHFIVVGLCSGAKLALETTLVDERIVGQILLNLQGYWHATKPGHQYVSRRTYFHLARQLTTWKRVARGETDIWGITKSIVTRTVLAVSTEIHEVWNRLWRKGGQRAESLAGFRQLADRQVATRLIYVQEDPGLDELEIVFGRDGGLLATVPNVSIALLKEGDHIFSWEISRRQLFEVVEQELEQMAPSMSSGSAVPAEPVLEHGLTTS